MMKRSELFFSVILIPVDILMIATSFVLAYYMRVGLESVPEFASIPIYEYLKLSIYLIPVWIFIYAIDGLYDTHVGRGLFDIFKRVFISNSVAILILSLGIFFAKSLFFSRLILIFIWLFSIILVMVGRIVTKSVQLYLLQFGIARRNVLLIGNNETAEFVAAEIRKNPQLGLKIVGIINGEDHQGNVLRRLGSVSQIESVVKKYKVDDIILVETRLPRKTISEIVQYCTNSNLSFKFIPDILAFMSFSTRSDTIGSMPVLELKTIALDGWGRIIKRIFDIIFSFVILLILSPLFLIVAIVQKSTSAGPIFFLHDRVGKDGKPFKLYKFRSMYTDQCDWKGEGTWTTAKDDSTRVTPFGRFMRKTNIDELPQFWNILIGDMSVVGPRPEQPKLVEKFNKEIPGYFKRHRIKSGLTGWAQVNGLKGDTSIAERVRYDTFYIENWSLWFDFKIIIKTIGLLLREIFFGKSEYSSRP